jgi:hypothetical protein
MMSDNKSKLEIKESKLTNNKADDSPKEVAKKKDRIRSVPHTELSIDANLGKNKK